MEQTQPPRRRLFVTSELPLWLQVIHWFIVVNLIVNAIYAGAQVFTVLIVPGVDGPLRGAAATIPHELLVGRRLYALEAWVSFVGLALYLAVTEMLPRLVRDR